MMEMMYFRMNPHK